jgi:hypothetical protein
MNYYCRKIPYPQSPTEMGDNFLSEKLDFRLAAFSLLAVLEAVEG